MAARSTTAGTPVKSCRMTLAGLKGISRSFSELSLQLRIVSTSASIKIYKTYLRTLDVEFIAVSDGTLEKHSD
jgi:hypothetical protein